MEEHQLPVQEEPVIVASNKKHSWSKKEKLALYIAGVFALVSIGFGGYTFYNQVIANAAGEDSLGADVVVDLPAANESPYFKIAWVSQQDIGVQITGDAQLCWGEAAKPTCDLQTGWRLEQSTNPADEKSWKAVHETDDQYHDATAACGGGSSSTMPTYYPILTSGLRHFGGSGTNCVGLDTSLGYSNPALMQPDTDYYFRAAKHIVTTEGDGTTIISNVWEPQGNVVSARTKSYPTLTETHNENQIVFSWTGAQGPGSNNAKYEFAIAKSTNPDDLTNMNSTGWKYITNFNDPSDKGVYAIDWNRAADTNFAAGQKTITQKANSTYYYALVALNRDDNGKILRLISKVYPVSTSTKVSTTPIVNMSVAPQTTSANKLDAIKLTASLKDSCVDRCGWWIDNTIALKDDYGFTTNRGMPADESSDDKSVTVSNDLRSITMSPIGSPVSQYSWGKLPTDILPGAYTLESTFTVNWNAVQTVKTPIVLTKVAPNLSAAYKATTVKYKSDVVINIKNAYSENYSVLPTGKIIVKNLNTKKTIKEITLAEYQTSRKITLKGVKKGKYNLAVIFQADTKKGIFQDQTINLPTLTVK